MSNPALVMFTCSGCGKQYKWKPELAGKRVKCKCGTTVQVPVGAQDLEEPEMYDLAPASVPMPHAKTGAAAPIAPPQIGIAGTAAALSPVSAVMGPQPVGSGQGAAVGGAPAAPVLAYASARPPRQATDDEQEIAAAARRRDFFLPIGLIAGGTVLSFYNAMAEYPVGLVGAGIIVTVSFIIDMAMILTACMIMVKIMDMSLGSPGQAILKVCAVAIAPDAIGDLVTMWMGPMSGMFVWSLTLVMYFILFKIFFDLDGTEMVILTMLIWLIRTWVGFLLVHMLLSGMMDRAITTISQATTPPPPPAAVQVIKVRVPPAGTAAQIDLAAADALSRYNAAEARVWLADDGERRLGSLSPMESAREVARLYQMSAVEVWVINLVEDVDAGTEEPATEIVVKLPGRGGLRANLMNWRNSLMVPLGYAPVQEAGQTYLHAVYPYEGDDASDHIGDESGSEPVMGTGDFDEDDDDS
jgi:hypothetical protein